MDFDAILPGSHGATIGPPRHHVRTVASIAASAIAKGRAHTGCEGMVEALDYLVDLRFRRAPAETEPDRPHPDLGQHAHRLEDRRELD